MRGVARFFWLVPLLLAGSARAEWTLGGSVGASRTVDSDVTLSDGSTRLVFESVSWDDESFRSPIYYGIRVGHWFDRRPRWGLLLEFTHAKMIADLDSPVRARGVRGGEAVDRLAPLRASFLDLGFSHGHNLLTVSALHRWLPERGADRFGRLRPYLRLGAGIAIPHVESWTVGGRTSEYQLAGPAIEAGAGLDVLLARRFSIFVESKVAWVEIDAELASGGTVTVRPWTHQVVLGFAGAIGTLPARRF